jgi:hypothetical protein
VFKGCQKNTIYLESVYIVAVEQLFYLPVENMVREYILKFPEHFLIGFKGKGEMFLSFVHACRVEVTGSKEIVKTGNIPYYFI